MPKINVLLSARRKQGGSQSVNDNAKGPAKSAGALLRRYGEQALRDVSDHMWPWKGKSQNVACNLILGYPCAIS